MDNQINSSSTAPQVGVARTYEMRQSQIEGKLSSKTDWYTFMEQHL